MGEEKTIYGKKETLTLLREIWKKHHFENAKNPFEFNPEDMSIFDFRRLLGYSEKATVNDIPVEQTRMEYFDDLDRASPVRSETLDLVSMSINYCEENRSNIANDYLRIILLHSLAKRAHDLAGKNFSQELLNEYKSELNYVTELQTKCHDLFPSNFLTKQERFHVIFLEIVDCLEVLYKEGCEHVESKTLDDDINSITRMINNLISDFLRKLPIFLSTIPHKHFVLRYLDDLTQYTDFKKSIAGKWLFELFQFSKIKKIDDREKIENPWLEQPISGIQALLDDSYIAEIFKQNKFSPALNAYVKLFGLIKEMIVVKQAFTALRLTLNDLGKISLLSLEECWIKFTHNLLCLKNYIAYCQHQQQILLQYNKEALKGENSESKEGWCLNTRTTLCYPESLKKFAVSIEKIYISIEKKIETLKKENVPGIKKRFEETKIISDIVLDRALHFGIIKAGESIQPSSLSPSTPHATSVGIFAPIKPNTINFIEQLNLYLNGVSQFRKFLEEAISTVKNPALLEHKDFSSKTPVLQTIIGDSFFVSLDRREDWPRQLPRYISDHKGIVTTYNLYLMALYFENFLCKMLQLAEYFYQQQAFNWETGNCSLIQGYKNNFEEHVNFISSLGEKSQPNLFKKILDLGKLENVVNIVVTEVSGSAYAEKFVEFQKNYSSFTQMLNAAPPLLPAANSTTSPKDVSLLQAVSENPAPIDASIYKMYDIPTAHEIEIAEDPDTIKISDPNYRLPLELSHLQQIYNHAKTLAANAKTYANKSYYQKGGVKAALLENLMNEIRLQPKKTSETLENYLQKKELIEHRSECCLFKIGNSTTQNLLIKLLERCQAPRLKH